jgi:hypothetical protein
VNLCIEYVDLIELISYANNSRTHSDAQINEIAKSMQEFGFTNPILIDPDRGIIAGHGRLLAAIQLGFVRAPTITLANLTELDPKYCDVIIKRWQDYTGQQAINENGEHFDAVSVA